MFEQVSQAGRMETRAAHARHWRGWRALPLLIGSVCALNCTAAESPLTPAIDIRQTTAGCVLLTPLRLKMDRAPSPAARFRNARPPDRHSHAVGMLAQSKLCLRCDPRVADNATLTTDPASGNGISAHAAEFARRPPAH